MNPLAKRIYDSLPIGLQNLAVSAFGWSIDRKRFGGEFERYRSFLEQSQWWPKERLQVWQDEQLHTIVKNAYENVPYYQKSFSDYGIVPSDIVSQSDLQKLPVLTRKDILSNFEALISRKADRRKLVLGHTSGTTGSPLEVYYDSAMMKATYAELDRQYSWAGLTLGRSGDRVAMLRGNVIVPIGQKRPPFWRYNRYHNQLLLSSFHLAPANLPYYLEEMNKYEPAAIDGYPSTVFVLARFILSQGTKFPVSAVLTSSETLFDFQKTAIEQAFESRVFDYLGTAERVIFTAECDRHEGHHLCSEYGVTEVLDKEGAVVAPGISGRLVCTTLHNMAMPLIRYVTNDVSAMKNVECSCGRGLPLMEDVTTKSEDILALRDGRMVSPSVLTHPFKPMHSVEESQIVQVDYDHIQIRIVPNEGYSEADTAHLVREFKARLGDEVQVDVTVVDALERTSSGKLKWVISKVAEGVKVPVVSEGGHGEEQVE